MVECNLAVADSDLCLSTADGWGSSYTCNSSYMWCNQYQKDMMRCCPHTCGRNKSLSKDECQKSENGGSCSYPFLTLFEQCDIFGIH